MAQPSPTPARVLQRHQSQITCDLLATPEPIRLPDDQHERQCRQRSYSGMGLQASCLRTLFPLPAQAPASTPRSSGSGGLATPADPSVAGSPTELAGMPPAVFVPRPATASSCSGDLRSGLPLATGSSSACAPAPCGAGATTVAADRDSPSSVL